MKDLFSEDVYTFDVDRWLSRYEDDFDVCRELAIAKPGVQPLPRKGVLFPTQYPKLSQLINTV